MNIFLFQEPAKAIEFSLKNVVQLAQLTPFALVCFKLHIVDKFMLQNVRQLLIVINQYVINITKILFKQFRFLLNSNLTMCI